MMPDFVKRHDLDAAGMMLMGAFLSRAFKTETTAEGRPQMAFPVPTLTIGAELDGLCRITRIAEALYTQVSFAEDPVAASHELPVTTIAGMTHMQFASGDPPKFVYDNDLKPEISFDEAHELVASDAVTFMSAILGQEWAALENRVQQSEAFVSPIVAAFKMEGYEQFLPACYCETRDEYGGLQYGTCVSNASCNGGSPWITEYAMPSMGAGLEGLSVVGANSIHRVTEENPSCHLPHIHGNET